MVLSEKDLTSRFDKVFSARQAETPAIAIHDAHTAHWSLITSELH